MIQSLCLCLIKFYQKAVSPLLPAMCRHDISCSEYMFKAIEESGVLKGISLGLRRLSTCHPFHQGIEAS